MSKRKITTILMALSLFLFAAGCKKKVPPPAPPPPPPPPEKPKPAPPKPTATLSVEPSSIERGQSATLRWSTSNATSMSINQGIGAVQGTGTRQIFPSSTTTYTLSVSGPGGSDAATATVTVTAPPPPPPPPPPPKPATRSLTDRIQSELQDAFFDYDKSDIREDARSTLTRNADALRSILNEFSGAVVTIEGHCDERGSAEYNLGLGDRRATAAKEFMTQLGVSGDRLRTVSYGKERPQCTDANEECWQRNRRVHFSPGQ